MTPDGDAVVSCSTDCSVRLFRLPFAPFAPGPVQDSAGAVLEFQGRHAFRGVDHHWTASKFATAGAQVQHLAGAPDCTEAGCGADRFVGLLVCASLHRETLNVAGWQLYRQSPYAGPSAFC